MKIVMLPLLLFSFSLGLLSCTSKVNEIQTAAQEKEEAQKIKGCVGVECNSCFLPWGGTLPEGQLTSEPIFTKSSVACTETCDEVKVQLGCENGNLFITKGTEKIIVDLNKTPITQTCEKKKCNCENDGVTVKDGAFYKFYKNLSVGCEKTCIGLKLQCFQGKLIDPKTPGVDQAPLFPAKSCVQIPCASCQVPWGGDPVSHKDTVKVFDSAHPICGGSCTNNEKTAICKNGTLANAVEGAGAIDFNAFRFPSCAPKQCNCVVSSTLTLIENTEATLYTAGGVECGKICEGKKFKCVAGALVDTTGTIPAARIKDYVHDQCAVSPCQNCGDILHLGNSTRFKGATVQCGKSCTATGNVQTFSCFNGKVSPELPKIEEFPSKSCSPDVCKPCTLACGTVLANNASTKCFSNTRPGTCGDSCDKVAQSFLCKDGVPSDLQGVPLDPTFAAKFTSNSCIAENACVGCKLPDGTQVEDKKKVSFYKIELAACGTSCISSENMVVLTCSNGVFGNQALFPLHKFTKCENKCEGLAKGDLGIGRIEGDGGGAPNNLCLIPWNKKTATHNTQFVAYSKGSVACGDKCSKYQTMTKCNGFRGTWSGGAKFVYPSCYEEKCP